MKTYSFVSTSVAVVALAAGSLHAGTTSSSPTAPAVNGLDIANLASAVTGSDKWFTDAPAAGQTFTTGAVPSLLKSITYHSNSQAASTKVYTIRVGTISGTTFSQIHSETATQTALWPAGHYMTWSLTTPLPLAANTTYAIDVAMLSDTAGWPTGIPYLNYSANSYAGGQHYTSGANGVAGTAAAFTSARDRIFHLDLQHPLNPSPDFGALVPAGNLTLSWTNLPPTTGTAVWVDVWFGTNAGAMTKVANQQQNLTSFLVNLPGANTYFWRIDSYLDGAPTGTPLQSSVFNFIVTDSDSDGFPDTYELANTNPPSATALNIGDDLEPDGLTNWQEFQLGTNPRLADTDGDTLNDGPETVGVGSRPATSPTKADTDGDGLNDGVESNTGTWAGVSNTGTNPTITDTDADGLADNVENNTGTYVSATNTGTSPLASDSDNDTAGDWYEVAASFTSPTSATSKPKIPYPLPAPGSSTGVTNKPVKVYIMSGQSNMVGFGRVSGTGVGTLNTMVNSEKKFPNLVTGAGAWAARQDVRYRGVVSAIGNDVLKPGFGANTDSFGPELGFGQVMGWYHDEPVLLLKTSIGNRSLLWDCLPPGGARFNYNGQTYAGYGESPNSWTIGGGPTPYAWYAGREYDSFFLDEEDMRPAMTWVDGRTYPVGCQLRHNGVQYVCKLAHAAAATSQPGIGATWATSWDYYNVTNAVDVLDNFATDYAGSGKPFQGQDFEIAGYVWFQGNKDLGEPGASRYEANLVALITQLRAYYANRYPGKCSPTAPFVIATGCGDPGTSGGGLVVANGQLAMNDAVKYPQFAGNVKTMDTRGYWRNNGPNTAQGYHYNHNAETYMLTGDALGRGMIDLLGTATPNGFTSWQTANGAASQTFAADHDGDGVSNGIEFFIGGPSGNTTGFTALPGIATAPVTGALSITWTKATGYAGTYGTDFRVETSDTLTGAWIAETLGGTVTITGNNITYNFPSLPGTKKFARLRVTGP